MRKALVAGNWKMYKTPIEAFQFAHDFAPAFAKINADFDVCLFPNFLSLPILGHECKHLENLHVGAQNCHTAKEGAFTGETSAKMVKNAGANYVLVGHSERREYNHENNALLLEKTLAALAEGLTVVYCCGEKLEDRKANEHFNLVGAQINEVVNTLSAEALKRIVVAYEPVWAIGTGETASPQQAQEMHAFIRNCLNQKFGEEANDVPILYGGSVKPNNAFELFSQADIDGGLVGGASLNEEDFLAIVEAMAKARTQA